MIHLCVASPERRVELEHWLKEAGVPLLPVPVAGGSPEEVVAGARGIFCWYDADFQHSEACMRALRAAWLPAAATGQLAKRLYFILPTEFSDPRALHKFGRSRPELDLLFYPEPRTVESRAAFASLLSERLPATPFSSLKLAEVPRFGHIPNPGAAFVGRDTELWELHGLLLESRQVAVSGRDRPLPVCITGMGGVGKSRLALEYTRLFGSAWPGGIFWMGRGDGDLRQALCDQLGIAPGPQEQREADLRARLEPLPPYLWVLDDPADTAEPAPTGQGSSLICRREASGLGRSLVVEDLGEEAALRLLGLPLPPELSTQWRGRVGGLPLALEVLGALLRAGGTDGLRVLWEQQSGEEGDAPLWSVLDQGLHRLSEGARDLLLLATLVESGPIPKILAIELLKEVDGQEEEEAEELLWIHVDEAASLAILQAESSSFRVHALIQSRTQRGGQARQAQLEDRLPAVLLGLLNKPSTSTIPKWTRLRPLLPHARQVSRRLDRPAQRRLLHRLAELDLEQGRARAAIASLERLLPEAKDEERTDILQNLAQAVGAAGDWRRALGVVEGLLAGQASGDAERLETEHIRAIALHHLGDQKSAEKLEEEVLAQRAEQWGASHPDSQASLQNLSLSRLARGEVDTAVAALRGLHKGSEQQLGAGHPETLLRLHNLALALHEAGETAEALLLGRQAREGRLVALGAEHPLSLTSLHNVACFRSALGDFDGAVQDYTECLRQSEELLGAEHPQSLGTAQNLAATLQARGDLVHARGLFEQVLATRTRVLGPEHPDRLVTLQNLGVLLLELGRPEDALPRLEEALRLRVQLQGADHPDSLMTRQNLGSCLVQLGKPDAAKLLIEESFLGYQRLYGRQHPLSLRCLSNLGNLHYITGNHAEARRIFEEVLADLEQLHPPDHPDRLRLVQNLGHVRAAQGDQAGARRLYEQARSGYERSLPAHHPERLRLEHALGGLCLAEGRPEEARAILENVYALRRAGLGPEHPQTVNTGRILEGMGDPGTGPITDGVDGS